MPDVKVISFLSTVYATEKQQENKRMIIKRHLSLVIPSMDAEQGKKREINEQIKFDYVAPLKLSEHLLSTLPSVSYSFQCPVWVTSAFRM